MNSQNLSPPPLLRLQKASKSFGGIKALDNVDFEVSKGEVHCLAGENGCGKSTLIKTITGVYKADEMQHFFFDGKSYKHLTPIQAQALGIRVIWQDLALFPEMSVAENIAFQSQMSLWPPLSRRKNLKSMAKEALAKLNISLPLDEAVKNFPIAKRQVIAIARALVGDTKLIFMDEPTASLTQQETDELIKLVHHLSLQGIAIVFVSHRLAEVLEISSRLTILKDGQNIGVYPTQDMTQSRIAELMTGKSFDEFKILAPHPQNPILLETKNLSRKGEYKNVNLNIQKGEIVGITGLLGAGRTELALSLFGLSKPDKGEIWFNEKKLNFNSNRDAIKAGIAYLSEDRLSLGLIQPQSIADNLVISSLDKIMKYGLLSSLSKAKQTEFWTQELKVKIGHSDDAISTLSGGNQQKVAIGKWLSTKPSLLILDAPTVGVDVGARLGIFNIVKELAAQGMSILIISDEISEVFYNCHRIYHMHEGQIVEELDPHHISLLQMEEKIYA